MKTKILTSVALATILMSNFAYAGGDMDPVEPQVVVADSVVAAPISDNPFYVGLAYSYITMDNDRLNDDITGNAVSLLAGYKFHPYFGVEARYSTTVGDLDVYGTDRGWDISNIGIYLKPQYDYNQIKLYGLLGYGEVTLDNGPTHSEDGFQWGLGASYAVNDNVDLFVDYTRLYDDNGFDSFTGNDDITVDSVNVGVSYKF